MPKFISGLKLSELFFKEAVEPLLRMGFPNLRYSAGLIDYGSEVLGFDTPRSTDHHWGPRLLLFVSVKDVAKKEQIKKYLSENLPPTFKGYSTHFGEANEIGVQLLTKAKKGQLINHRVEIYTMKSFFKGYLSLDLDSKLTATDWLVLSEQKLATIRSGRLFHDQLGLQAIRNKLNYFPTDVWLYMLASEWTKIGQEEPFMGRMGDVGDELGSKVIAARLVQTIMRLCFLMEKQYAPYSKWFGTAFSHLKCAYKLSPILNNILGAEDWKSREKYLSCAYNFIAEMHNRLKITKPLPIKTSPFFDRPYLVIHGSDFATEIKKKIKDPSVKKIGADIGSVNQFSNSVDLLENDKLLKKLKILY